MRIADGVYLRRLYFSIPLAESSVPRSTYSALLVGKKIALVDTGVSYHTPDIAQLCAEAGVDIGRIDYVINTHCHADHTGGDRRLKDLNPAVAVMASKAAKPAIEDPASQFAARPIPGFDLLMSGPVSVERVLQDGDEVDLGFPVRVVASPGHSADSISLFLPEQSTLIVGDAVPYPKDVPIYDDLEALESSLNRLQECKPDHVLSALGGHMPAYGSSWPFDDARAYLVDVQAAVEDFEAFYGFQRCRDPQLERVRFVLKRMGVESEVLPFVLRSIQEHVKRATIHRSGLRR